MHIPMIITLIDLIDEFSGGFATTFTGFFFLLLPNLGLFNMGTKDTCMMKKKL